MAGTFIFQELPPKERIIALSKNCIRKEEFAFTVSLTEDELNAEKDQFARLHMRKDQLKDELKLENDRIKAEIKKIDTDAEKTLEVITMEQRKRTEEVFLIPDHTTNVMTYVTKTGEVVHTREMQASEKQGRLFTGEAQQPDVVVEAVVSEKEEPAQKDIFADAWDAIKEGFTSLDHKNAWSKTWDDHIGNQLNLLDQPDMQAAQERLEYLKSCRFEIVGDGETYEYVNGAQLTWGDVRDLNDDEWDFQLTETMGPREDPGADQEYAEKADIISGRVDQLRELGYEPDEFGYRKGEQLITHAQFQDSTTDEWYGLIGIEPKGEGGPGEDIGEQEPITNYYNPGAVEENPAPAKKKRTTKKKNEEPSNN